MKRILVCLDASPRAELVLRSAVDVATKSGAKLILLRAVGLPAEIDQELYVHSPMGMMEVLIDKARRDLESLAKSVPDHLFEALDVRVGTPWDSICREAVTRDCDLVVLGSHGHSSLSRMLGTTAAKVVNHCERSVLIVRAPLAL
jgi:universal stress protein F